MFENLCTLPLDSDIFSTALHPSQPLITVGTSSGHVETFRLPPPVKNDAAADSDSGDATTTGSVLSDGRHNIESVWKTRRHKGSCRCLAYAHDGSSAYSAGTDALVKHFDPLTGQVISKFAIPTSTSQPDAPTLLHVLNPQSLLLATDSGALHIIPLLEGGKLAKKASQTHNAHSDFVSAITPLPPTEESTSGFSKQWVSIGGTTLAVTDIRRGVLVRSDDQEDELMSSCFIPGMGPKGNRKNGMVAIGTASGVLTLWDKGSWDDQQERIIVDTSLGSGRKSAGESIDTIVLVPQEMGLGKKVVCGMGDGKLVIVDLQKRSVFRDINLRHDDLEAVVSLGFDSENRLISAGGKTIKVWEELTSLQGGGDDEEEEEQEEDSDDDGDSDAAPSGKRAAEDSDDSDEEGGGGSGGLKAMQLRAKRRKENNKKKFGPMGAHGVLGFDGLD